MTCCEKIQATVSAKVAELQRELEDLSAAGDEYHASQVREEMRAVQSLARLVHAPDVPIHF